MSDLDKDKIIGPGLLAPSEAEIREQVLITALAAFDNPLEALGIVMRETGISVYFQGNELSFDRELKEIYTVKVKGSFVDVSGQDLLNTLKEGKL